MTKVGSAPQPELAPTARVDWRHATLFEGTTLARAIRCLDESSLQIALVVAPDQTLLGTLTDGDVRRGLLGGMDLDTLIDPIINRSPLVVPPQMDRKTALQLMQANKIHQLPVVDDDRRLGGLHLWDELMVPVERANWMVIMAGGRGTRLHPHTEHSPKPMLPVGGRPMLEHILERAKGDGLTRFVIAVHFLGHMIEEYFGDGSRWQVQIAYLREQHPLGTAGALALLDPCPDAPFVVSNGDVLTDIHYSELLDFHGRYGAAATMAVRLHEWRHPFGVVRTKGVDIVGFEEKPIARTHINAGIYVLEPTALDVLHRGEFCNMPTLFGRLQERNARTIVYPMHEPWLDVGRAADLERAQEHHRAKL